MDPFAVGKQSCLIALGANLGDRVAALKNAVQSLADHPQIEVQQVSDWWTYPAVGGPDGQPPFLNGALLLQTDLEPESLARQLHRVEASWGRERSLRWDARTLDCDLLLYGNQQIDSDQLQVPHPRMMTRRFVLEPAAQIAETMVHPDSGRTMGELLEHLNHARPRFAFVGPDQMATIALAKEVARQVGAIWHPEMTRGEANGHAGSTILGPIADLDAMWENPEREKIKLHLLWGRRSSSWGRRFFAAPPRQRPLAVFLSEPWDEALQDATGAILAMR